MEEFFYVLDGHFLEFAKSSCLIHIQKRGYRLFPCGFFLKALRDRHNDWKDLTIKQMFENENKDCIHRIVSEYEYVPLKTLIKPLPLSRKAYNIIFSPFIQKIVKTFGCSL